MTLNDRIPQPLDTIPSHQCIYGRCRALNLCSAYNCTGYRMLKFSNSILENGTIRPATPEEKDRLLNRIHFL